MDMMEKLREKARKNPQKIAFPEATEENILRAAMESKSLGVAVRFSWAIPRQLKLPPGPLESILPAWRSSIPPMNL